jgi:hypothetical protein
MNNKLLQVGAQVRRLSAVEAEVWLSVEAEHVGPATEVRGRLMGPRCPGVTTVEVAYPLRPFARHPEGLPPLSRQVLIPDPNLWEPRQPFVYRAVVELWEGGRRCDRREFDCGLRMADGGRPATSPDTGRSS